MNRVQISQIIKDLQKKIVFIVGPRQVGKTWLAKKIGERFKNPVYLNFDHLEDRKIMESYGWLKNTDLLILDELHKMKSWKNYIKGVFDTKTDSLKILVTGSARLDAFRQSGDSLAGRFFTHRLLPFSPAETKHHDLGKEIDRFIDRGGFPEPFLTSNDTEAKRWRNQYIDGLIRNDVLDFENIHDFRAIKTLLELLRRSVGAQVSMASIARDVGVSSVTVKRYLEILESLFIVFKIYPHSKNIGRSILKSPKVYFYDTGLVKGDKGAKFENLVALSLLKHIYGLNDSQGEKLELKYLRDKEGHEIDFCLVTENKVNMAIEVKVSSDKISAGMSYFTKKYGFPGIMLLKNLHKEFHKDGIEFRAAEKYLKELFI